MFNFTITNKRTATLALMLALVLPFVVSAETVVENNVSVTASGGEATAKIKSVVNGETVEDITITGEDSISYTSNYTAENSTTSITINSTEDRNNQLRDLLNRLVSLLSLYVSKLAS